MSSNQQKLVQDIEEFPHNLQGFIKNSDNSRSGENSWSLAQIIHHLADAHTNKLFQIKLSLTEDNPDLPEFSEKLFSNLPDAKEPHVENSLAILNGVHSRTALLLKSLTEKEWKKQAHHPQLGTITIEKIAQSFVTHQESHLKQIKML